MSRTLFIHIPKNAGTSISASCPSVATSPRYMNDKMLSVESMLPRGPNENSQGFHKHIPFSYLDKHKIERFDRTFAVIRNPWERLVSLYHHADVIKPKVQKTWYDQDKISWDDFVNKMDTFKYDPTYYWRHPYDQWASQLDWVSIGEKVKCDILRYEHIQSDLDSYFETHINLKKENVGVYKKHYTEYYTKEQKEKVADWFRMDISYWGFSFESGATKNYWTP